MRAAMLGVAVLFGLGYVAAAQAQAMQCLSYTEVRDDLASKYGEVPAATAQDQGGNIVLLFANPETGTWSLGISPPDKAMYCPVASGGGWMVHPVTKPPVAMPDGQEG